jgi:glutamate-1-semialdehyde aminotransferase
MGKKLFENWNKIAKKYDLDVKMIGYPIRMTLKCYNSKQKESLQLKALILQEMVKKGIFMSPGPTFISFSHSLKDITKTLHCFEETCNFISKNVYDDNYQKFLNGTLPQTIFTNFIKSTKKK